MNNAFKVQFLGSYKGKSFLQVKTHLVTKNADRTGTGTVRFFHPIIQDMLQKPEVLLHACKLEKGRDYLEPVHQLWKNSRNVLIKI